VKHGLLAREIIAASPDGFAGRKEFTKLLSQLHDEIASTGVLENWQVQRIAMSFYMQSVIVRAQMGKFRKQNAIAKLRLAGRVDIKDQDILSRWQEMMSARDSKRRAGLDPPDLTDMEMEMIGSLHESVAGISLVSSFLRETRHDCESSGIVTKEQQNLVREYLGRKADPILLQLSMPGLDQPGRFDAFLKTLHCKSVIFAIKARLSHAREQPDIESLIIPDQADLLLRYYAFYSREADRAMAELEHLQRRRSGQLVVPPPLRLEVPAGS
jgi:hypothetical protein